MTQSKSMTLLGAKIQNKVRDIVLKMLLALLPPDLLFHFQIGIVFVNKFVYSSHINQAQKKQPDLMRRCVAASSNPWGLQRQSKCCSGCPTRSLASGDASCSGRTMVETRVRVRERGVWRLEGSYQREFFFS